MTESAIPPARVFGRHVPSDTVVGEDGSLMLAAYEGREADFYWLTFLCAGEHGCWRAVNLGFRPAIARFGRAMTIRGIARRLRCSACGGQKISAQVAGDTRGEAIRARDGLAPAIRHLHELVVLLERLRKQ